MVIIAVISLVLGVLCGQWFFSPETAAAFAQVADYALYVLMLSVGISVGMSRQVFGQLREYHIKILIIPAGILAGTIAGGILASWICQFPLNTGVSIACGLGWYSLAGVLITDLAGADMGGIAFLSNLMREILSFLLIPFISKYLNKYTAIAPAAATSEDTTLPILIKYSSEEIVVVAVFNGVLCSAAVPILIKFFHSVL